MLASCCKLYSTIDGRADTPPTPETPPTPDTLLTLPTTGMTLLLLLTGPTPGTPMLGTPLTPGTPTMLPTPVTRRTLPIGKSSNTGVIITLTLQVSKRVIKPGGGTACSGRTGVGFADESPQLSSQIRFYVDNSLTTMFTNFMIHMSTLQD
ncbi:hypothetical protein MSG28_001643 [Choristoneura fumiferana]|uniref:Uncharacterized protein n=1 Tax=Choristoneura fumiferana TaxID=7141 RepID=A0ACC0KVF8_CHOFU|nr:hypothetical protein MSG28_001643 [Choristoneura fumiferana]